MTDQPTQRVKLTEARKIACKYADKFGNIDELSKAIQSFAKQEVKKALDEERDESDIVNFLVWYSGRGSEYRYDALFEDVAKEYTENPIPHHLRKKKCPECKKEWI